MGDISRNFSRHEFACKCSCGMDTADYGLIIALEGARAYFGNRQVVITANGGYRCPIHNRAVGGVPGSMHQYGRAADHVILGVPVLELYQYYDAQYPNSHGIGYYENNFIHLDSRSIKARW